MVYANMVLAHGGAEEFARRAAEAGAAGAIVPDLPLGEAEEVREAFAAAGLALVPLLAPTTPAERRGADLRRRPGLRLRRLDRGHDRRARRAAGGARRSGRRDQGRGRGSGRGRLRDRHARAGGRRWGEIADGVIIGSRLVRAAGEAGSAEAAAEAVGEFLRETRAALAALDRPPIV